ncbi:hypothetical protein GMJAKD_17625 [Candidatus Electrothrix aarhusensis]
MPSNNPKVAIAVQKTYAETEKLKQQGQAKMLRGTDDLVKEPRPLGTASQVYNTAKKLYKKIQRDRYKQNVIIKLLNKFIIIFSLIIIEAIIVILYFKLLKLIAKPFVGIVKMLFPFV